MSEGCKNFITYCREEAQLTNPRTSFCSIAFRDCLAVLPQDVCETKKNSYVFDEATKECKRLPPPPSQLEQCLEAATTPKERLECSYLECNELGFGLDQLDCKKQMCLEAATTEEDREDCAELGLFKRRAFKA